MFKRRAFALFRWLAAGKRRTLALLHWLVVERGRVFAILRWLAAIGLGAWTVREAIRVGHEEQDLVFAAVHSLYAFAGLLASVLLVSSEVAWWALSPVNRIIDAVLSPGGYEPPPADYTLARMYRGQMRYEEACDEYLKIIRYHPRELRAYLEGMNTAGEARQTGLAARFYRLGKRAFRREETRRKLQAALEQSCSYALLADEGTTTEEIVPPPNEVQEAPPAAPPDP